MRQGMNPQKEEQKLKLVSNHRIIIVVYIPEEVGFYKNSFEVFKLCLESLIHSVTLTARISIVNNGSNNEVTTYLNQSFKIGEIDTLISHRSNIGKIDALIGAARGSREPLITLTDSDILFKSGWQEKVEEIFNNFKNVGSVSPIPVRNAEFYATSSTLKQVWLRRLNFKYTAIPENFDDFNKYLKSINWPKETDKNLKWPVVDKQGCKAIIGSGHQVLTVNRRILFDSVPFDPSFILVGNNSEYRYVDEPIDKSGRLRLSTYHNYAYHMGNKVEPWMKSIDKEKKAVNNINPIIKIQNSKGNTLTLIKKKTYIAKKLFHKYIFSLLFRR